VASSDAWHQHFARKRNCRACDAEGACREDSGPECLPFALVVALAPPQRELAECLCSCFGCNCESSWLQASVEGLHSWLGQASQQPRSPGPQAFAVPPPQISWVSAWLLLSQQFVVAQGPRTHCQLNPTVAL
jgi:hypothetical protein